MSTVKGTKYTMKANKNRYINSHRSTIEFIHTIWRLYTAGILRKFSKIINFILAL